MRAPPLPTDSVTFLMTDIEGSTRAWQRALDGLAEATERHYQILDAGVSEHGGVRPEEQGEGDSVVAVFTDPVAALRAAVSAQLRLRDELPELPVRMALHTGDAMLRNERNYAGLTIIRCARIRACGYGGQILLSDVTAGLVDERLPADWELDHLGVYGLRGLDGRAPILQLVAPGLPRHFPPLKAGASATGNMPRRISSFVGRRDEVARLSVAVDDHRLVSLVGEPGIGKSRLAHAVAEAALSSYAGGSWWIPLAMLDTDDIVGVAETVANVCAITVGAEPVDSVVTHFASLADAVIVLDGTDRCVQGATAFAELMLAHCEDLRVVSTGRTALRLPGEEVHRLGPLSTPEAALLFVDRSVSVGGELGDDDAERVAELCSRLGGVPHDIEVAAARTDELSVGALLDQLDQVDERGERHAPLVSSERWSYQLLAEETRTVLARLSVFRGAIDADAAVFVSVGEGIDEPTAARAMRDLLDHVATVDDDRISIPRRYRDIAAEELEQSREVAMIRRRHARWCAGVAERFAESGLAVSVTWLAPDLPDVFAAIENSIDADWPESYRFAVALGARWHQMGRPDLGSRLSEWIATRPPSDAEMLWAAAVARLGFHAMHEQGHPLHAFRDEAIAIAELGGDVISPLFLAAPEAARQADLGHVDAARLLWDQARSQGVEEVAAVIGRHLAIAYARSNELSDGATVRAALAEIDGSDSYRVGAFEESGATVLGDMAEPTW